MAYGFKSVSRACLHASVGRRGLVCQRRLQLDFDAGASEIVIFVSRKVSRVSFSAIT